MNKIISFNKDINFNKTIGEIVSIALDDTLKLIDSHTISGDLIVYGCNKVSDDEKSFKYPLPVEIAIDSKYDTSKCTISIDNFYYEIVNEEILKVNIDLLIDNLYYQEIKAKPEELIIDDNRDLNLDFSLEKAKDNIGVDFSLEKKKVEDSPIEDLFKEIKTDEKEYSIYRVYTVLENETLEYIMDKYKVTKDDLVYYNDLENIHPGVKLIIPSIDE